MMIKVVEHKFSRNTEILEMSENDILLKRPVILANVNKKIILSKTASSSYTGRVTTAGKEETAKKVSAYHGQIAKNAEGETDLVAEFNKHPDALWIRVKAIEADVPNDNGDCFSKAEIIKSYKTFEGVPVFTNHENDKVENAKGKVVKAEWDAKEAAVYCTMFIDRKASPSLCRAIEEGYVTDVSMGTQVEESSCSICNNRAADAANYCSHVKGMKGRTFEGKRVYENNYGLKFIEISVVTDGACKDCTIREVLGQEDFLVKVAGAVEQFRKTASFTKNGGQVEVQKLNQAMDLLEDVSKTMLGQRKFIDMDFLKKVTAVLADLQEVTDELVDQGYATMGVQQPQPSIPAPPPEVEMSGETPALTETEGVGKVTEPITNEPMSAAASSEKREIISNIKERMKELNNNFAKINKEANETKGDDSVENKYKETTLKLAKIWENPSVKEYVTQFGDGEYTIVFSKDEIVGVKGGKRVASIKRASLDEDIRLEIEKNPSIIGKSLLEALRESEMSGKIKTASTDALEEITEKQLDSKKDTSPRDDKDIEETTEGQLDKQKSEYISRQNKDIEETTEEQLAKSSKGYDYHKRKEEDGEETTETRLRNKGIAGNSNPSERTPASEGVKDQTEQTTGGQLDDWNKAEKGFSPKDETTEKQLESWGRKIASESDAKKAINAGTKAITQTAIATGATPDELINIIADIDSSDDNKIAAKKAVASLSSNKTARLALYRRSKFHGANKTASTEVITDYLLGALSDNGLGGEVGIKVLAGLIERKNAHAEISEAISTASAEKEEGSIKTASVDFLKKVLAGDDDTDSIVVQLKPEQIGIDKDESEFAETAFALANRKAAESGIKISANIHVKKTTAGVVEVTMKGKKISESSLIEKIQVSPAPKINIEARKEARLKLAQMGGTAPDPMAGGAAPAGGGTTMPPPPAAPGATPPVSSLGTPPPADPGMGDAGMDDDSEETDGEAVPPGSICPACGSKNTDCKDSEFSCRDCGAEGAIEVNLRMKTWPGTVKETTPKKEDEDEGGIGDAAGGEGAEMPPLGIAATYRIKPEMIKKAGSKPLGSFCPYCASSNVKLACKNGCTKANCKACGGYYTVDMAINEKNEILARTTWADKNFSKFTSKETNKKAELTKALSQTGMTKKFASANADTKVKIIGKLIEKGWIK